MAVLCSDGTALITYTGIGKVGGVTIADWVRHLIRGEKRTVDQMAILLRESATQTFPSLAPGEELTFNIGAFVGGRAHAALITNRRLDGSVQNQFEISAIQVQEHNPRFVVTGTREAVSKDDRALLKKMGSKKKRSRSNHALLAGINLRASKNSSLISPACITAHMPPKGVPIEYRQHDPANPSTNTQHGTIPLLLFEMDFTEPSELMLGDIFRRLDGVAVDEGEAARRVEEAIKRAMVPRNLLKK